MLRAYNKTKRPKGHRSTVEAEVELALQSQGLAPQYETDRLPYVLHKKYTPDFKVGDAYIEVKGWWPPADRAKFLAVVINNPGLRIVVALQKPNMLLSKSSKTTYAKWCTKHGINWCPIPIPEAVLEWLQPRQVQLTFLAPTRTVAAVTVPQCMRMEALGASSASLDSTPMANDGMRQ
jgi:hypothetical protein